MKVSLNWLKEYLPITQSPEEVADALTMCGLEAEGIERVDGDAILEIGLTPNLGHCLSILGMARELAAISRIPLEKKVSSLDLKEGNSGKKVRIEDSEQCKSYLCCRVEGVQIGPSPDWLVQRLESAGLRSINCAVDIGNLVMLELGQPLHMFDADKLEGEQIVLQRAHKEQTMYTLDEIKRNIPDGTLLVRDAEKPIAFAGVMGELSTAVTEQTKNILIEAAHFTPQAARLSSKLLQLRTDSSQRFERGIDPQNTKTALRFAAQHLAELCGGSIIGTTEEIAEAFTPKILDMRPDQANRLLGTQLNLGEMSGLLQRLEMEILEESEERIRVKIPSYRNDLNAEIDLIEEVGRMYGFNNIPRGFPKHNSSLLTHAPLFLFEEETREKLIGLGLQECLTCDLISPKLAALTAERALKEEALIGVLHPSSSDQSILRPSLLPGLLEVVKFNLDRKNAEIAAFEVGHVHFKDREKHYGEPVAGIILSGAFAPYHHETKPREFDFFHLKGFVENFLEGLGLDGSLCIPSHSQNFHPRRQGRIDLDGLNVGILGEILPSHLSAFGIGQRVFYAEINLHDLIDLKKTHHRAKKFSPYPGSQRDWTATMLDKAPIGDVLQEIESLKSPLLEEVFLLDLYKSEKIGKDRKNATFRFQYRDPNKTIAYEEVEKEHQRLIQHMAEKLGNIVP